MNKKKIFSAITILVLLLALVAALCVGCKEAGNDPAPTETDSITTQPNESEPAIQETEPNREPGVYYVTILPTANGTVTADCTQARQGDTITLTVTPNEGYETLYMTANGFFCETTFQMPAEDVSVVARFGLPEDEVTEPGETKVYPNGKFFGSVGNFHCSDVLNMKTDSGKNPYLVMDSRKATPLYAYVKGMTAKQFYFELTAEVTGIRSDEKYPKFGLMTNDGKEMVKFYLDMTTEKQVSAVGAVRQKSGKGDDWAGQSVWNLNKKLDLSAGTVKLGLLRDGYSYYFYVNDQLVASGDDLSDWNMATGIFSFGTSLKVTEYKLVKKGSEWNDLLAHAQADNHVFRSTAMTENFFSKSENGGYALSTNSDAQHLVDDVTFAGKIMRESYYSLSGKLTLTDADTWGQARILISSDAKNEYFIALEKTGEDSYQIFTMSKANEEGWNDWRMIESAALNGNRNSIDFEVIVNGDQVYFLIDNEIYYTGSRVPMLQSTVKFTGYNVGTSTVENLSLQVFADSTAAAEYAASKCEKAYETQFQSRMDDLYKEYITDNGCAGKGGTLIFGDSNMDFWGAWEEQTGLTKYVNGYNVGIGGSTTKDWLHAYDQLIKPFHADRFVILVGGNDVNVWGNSGEETVDRLALLFEKLHADHPDAEIYYIYTTPSPSAYANGGYTSGKLGALVSGAKELCDNLGYVQGIDIFDLMVAEDKQNSNESLFAEDKLHMNEAGYKVFSDYLYNLLFRGETFGAAGGYKTTNGIDLSKDTGDQGTVKIFGGAPKYAYLHDIYTDKFCFETEINVENVLNGDNWPKFGLMVNGSSEMVKFFVDMTKQMTATHVGVVYQPAGGGDDWAGSISCAVAGMSFTGSNTIALKLVRDGRAYYFYVNDALVLFDEDGFKAEQGAVGIFSFNTVLTAGNYKVATGSAADSAIKAAKEAVAEKKKLGLTCNWFADNGDGRYSLTTNSNAEHKVDDLTQGGNVLRTANYSVKGKLTLTNAGDWGQARILISADAKNEYFIALERTNTGKFQIFTMSKANQTGWDKWELILHQDDNGTRNSIDFELIVIGKQVHFLIDNQVVYTTSRVSMTESTVKFTGYNVGTTTIENLSAQIFESQQAAQNYLAEKN